MQVTAAVVNEPEAPFAFEPLELEEPRADEVLVRVVASGVCHTDDVCRNQGIPVPLPVVLGHEGSGVVERVGADVTDLAPGDHVVLSWGRGCGKCPNCLRGEQAYCDDMGRVSFGGTRLTDGSTSLSRNGEDVHSHFIGQSSFATYAVVPEAHAVKVDDDVPLELLGPLGCGVLTGAGAVFDALDVEVGSAILVTGTGAVGLSAIMAANVLGCTPIIAVDTNRARLELARELGATHALHPDDGDLAEALAAIAPGGVDNAIETTANPQVLRTALEAVRLRGTCASLGAAPMGTELTLDAFSILLGRTLRGVIVGDGVPSIGIPRLISLYKAGRFPFDRLVKFYDFEDLDQAFQDSANGVTVKPVVRMA